jgi:Ca2+-binding EF-hand superfamily protein
MMTTRQTRFLSAISGLLLAAMLGSTAWSQSDQSAKDKKRPADQTGAGRLYLLMDRSGEGKIDLQEYTAWQNRQAGMYFAGKDEDRDGQLSFQEFARNTKVTQRQRFYMWDTSNPGFVSDGYVTPQELDVADNITGIAFDGYDTDGDGRISWTEAETKWDETFRTMFANQDDDGNGGLSLAEHNLPNPAGVERRFNRGDKDGDGYWDREEFVATYVESAKSQANHAFKKVDTRE